MRSLGAVFAALPLVVALGCQLVGQPKTPNGAPGADGTRTALELRQAADRPPIGLIARDGDPAAAVAFAVAHDFGSEASVFLGELLAARLRARGFSDVRARAHGLGVVLSVLVHDPAEAARFVEVATTALELPVSSGELGEKRSAARVPTWRSSSEAAVGGCSGELGVLGSGAASVAVEPPDARALEAWRSAVFSAQTVAFAATGASPVLEAAARKLSDGPSWPKQAVPADAWPAADQVGNAPAPERRVSIAYRVGDAARTASLAQSLGAPGSRLGLRLSALAPGWTLDRVVATSRVRGACLRLDVRATRVEPAPRPLDVARVVAVVDEEARPELERPASTWTLDQAVVRPSDPREASSAAAWRALSGRQDPGPTRRLVSYAAPGADGQPTAAAEVERTLAKVEAGWQRSSVQRRTRIENGQGELWALLASPCGTIAEGTDDAGTDALLMRSLAARSSGQLGVSIEAWTTPDGVGLLAHAPRLGPNESAEAHARRVGDALGRALVAARLAGPEVAGQRVALLDEIGPAEQHGFWTALEAVSGGHPSWLDPRGTWNSISALSPHELEAHRRSLLSGPLRLAAIANAGEGQAATLAQALDVWLRPDRVETHACPTATRAPAKTGELSVEVEDPSFERAYVAVPLSLADPASPRAAASTLFLLNRPGGWLDSALRSLPGGASAHATLLGGRQSAALVVEVRAADTDTSAAVAQVRGLFERLASGALSSADATRAEQHFAGVDATSALEPRKRLLDSWRGTTPKPADIAAMRQLQRALGPTAHLVVSAKARK